MLSAVVLNLQPLQEESVPVSHGSLAYAAALDLLLRVNPALACIIHDQSGPKSMTVSPLLGHYQSKGNYLYLRPDSLLQWRLTGLDETVSTNLLQISPDIGGIRIGEAVFMIKSIAKTTDEDPEAGQDTYYNLVQRWSNMEAPPAVPNIP